MKKEYNFWLISYPKMGSFFQYYTLLILFLLKRQPKGISKRDSVGTIRGGCYNYRFKLYKWLNVATKTAVENDKTFWGIQYDIHKNSLKMNILRLLSLLVLVIWGFIKNFLTNYYIILQKALRWGMVRLCTVIFQYS